MTPDEKYISLLGVKAIEFINKKKIGKIIREPSVIVYYSSGFKRKFTFNNNREMRKVLTFLRVFFTRIITK